MRSDADRRHPTTHSNYALVRMDRPLYLLPFRVIVGAGIAVLGVGLVAGAVGGWLTARRALRVTSTGDRVLERVEQVTVTAEEALANAAADIAPSVATVIDGRGRTVASAVALTKDGVLISAGLPPAAPVRVRRAGGETTDASIVRVYPEFGLYFLRAPGDYAVPAIERETPLRPGQTLMAVARTPEGSGYRVRAVTVESDGLVRGDTARLLPALPRVPAAFGPLPASYRGAPVAGTGGRLAGVVLTDGPAALVLPGTVVDRLLRDALDHQEETVVVVQSHLVGSWRIEEGTRDSPLVFRVTRSSGPLPSQGEAVRAGDDIVAVRGEALHGPAPLALPLLDAARKQEPLPVTVRRGKETVQAAVVPPRR